jgi:hypothetical protein
MTHAGTWRVGALAFLVAAAAWGAEPGPGLPVPTVPPAQGLAVLAVGDAAAVAWPLAQAVYANEFLRPAFGEGEARVLAGEPAPPNASSELRDLADSRAAVHGDDAPSRRLLSSLSAQLHVRAIVTVQQAPPSKPSARLFLATTGAFDAATYAPDDSPGLTWNGTVKSLERTFVSVPAPAAATAPVAPAPQAPRAGEHTHTPFYKSPWFWGALGAAAFGAGAVYFATRDNSPSTIHLQVQVPK